MLPDGREMHASTPYPNSGVPFRDDQSGPFTGDWWYDPQITDNDAAAALVNVVGDTRWEAVTFARGFIAKQGGQPRDEAAKGMFDRGPQTLKKSKELLEALGTKRIIEQLTPRKKIGSAENPITKLFPAAITEQRFLELLDELTTSRPSVTYMDNREARSLVDFTLAESGLELPINVKNAGTKFKKAASLVRLAPRIASRSRPTRPTRPWRGCQTCCMRCRWITHSSAGCRACSRACSALRRGSSGTCNGYAGSNVRAAEDVFVTRVVRLHWANMKAVIAANPFHIVSARKWIRVLQTKPKRTPGIGLKAWVRCGGRGQRPPVDPGGYDPWPDVVKRIIEGGITEVIAANRRVEEVVYDPEI